LAVSGSRSTKAVFSRSCMWLRERCQSENVALLKVARSRAAAKGDRHRLGRWFTTETILLTAGLLLLGYLLGEVILLVFAAILLAVGLDGLARAIAARSRVSRGWALTGVAIGIAAIIAAARALSATRLIQQFQQVSEQVIAFIEGVHAWLLEHGAMGLIEGSDDENGDLASAAGDMAGQAMTYGMSAVGALASIVILIVLTSLSRIEPDPVSRRGGAPRAAGPSTDGGRHAVRARSCAALVVSRAARFHGVARGHGRAQVLPSGHRAV